MTPREFAEFVANELDEHVGIGGPFRHVSVDDSGDYFTVDVLTADGNTYWLEVRS